MYVHKLTTVLSASDCRALKRACTHARDIRRPLNTHVTFAPYPGSLPTPAARSTDLNRLLSRIRAWLKRKVEMPLTGLWVWHADVIGRNPHVHIFMHCPSRRRDEMADRLIAAYRASVTEVKGGSDIRRPHPSGYWSSTLDYICRFKSQQAWWADRGRTYRETTRDANGRRRGVPGPILGRRWGCTRNISSGAVDEHLNAKAEARAVQKVLATGVPQLILRKVA